jgi:pimeloyl-ACP methyl ester carboxylesterase
MTDALLHKIGGKGPDILLVHGFGADRFSWLALAPKLFQFGTIWAIEYGAHGAAGNDVGDGSLTDLTAAIEAKVKKKLKSPIIVGHSLGGTLALSLISRGVVVSSGLVLLAPAGLSENLDISFIRKLPEVVDGAAAHELLKQLVVRKNLITKRMADAFVETLEDVSRRAALRTISTTLKTAAPPPFPPNIPYTVLWGDSDEILSPPSRLPIEFQLFANVGHLPHVEAVNDVVKAIQTIINQQYGLASVSSK